MPQYKVRMHTDTVYQKLLEGCTAWKYCKHNADQKVNRTHYHYYLETHLSLATIQKRCKEHPEYEKGNGFYATAKIKYLEEGQSHPVSYLGYMMHDALEDEQSENLNTLKEKMIECRDEYVAAMIKKREKAKNKKTQLQIMEEEFNYTVGDVDAHQVIDDVINYYKKEEKLVREFQMVSQVQTLLLKYDPSYRDTLSTNIIIGINKVR